MTSGPVSSVWTRTEVLESGHPTSVWTLLLQQRMDSVWMYLDLVKRDAQDAISYWLEEDKVGRGGSVCVAAQGECGDVGQETYFARRVSSSISARV